MDKSSSNTTGKQRKKQPGGITGKGFVKGDPRINRKGRPKTFDKLRELSQQIANEIAIYPLDDVHGNHAGDPVVINGHKVTLAEAILRKWSRSKDTRLQMRFVEVAYGKVPDQTEISGSFTLNNTKEIVKAIERADECEPE